MSDERNVWNSQLYCKFSWLIWSLSSHRDETLQNSIHAGYGTQ